MNRLILSFFLALFCLSSDLSAQTVARIWNEELLQAIREDFARPTVHARNLYHTSLALYDAWAVYDDEAQTHLLGKTLGNYTCPLDSFPMPLDIEEARRTAMSYAAYRVLRYRFRQSPSRPRTWFRLDSVMFTLGYDTRNNSTVYQNGDAAALGNYLGSQIITYGNLDGANDANDYANTRYEPVNFPLIMDEPGNPDIIDPDRWQPLSLSVFIDQSGNPIPGGQQSFLGPEWGQVVPFAMDPSSAIVRTRDSFDYKLYHDPGPPPYINDPATREHYQRGFEMVAIWSGLLDPADGAEIDISPGAVGRNADPLPDIEGYFDYYNEFGGGDTTSGLRVNPFTGQPYAPNIVKRGDYGRVLAEFWADGPDSETPPGHWFTILNYVMDQPSFKQKWIGQGPDLDRLEYEVKAYLTLGGAMHDAAISCWGIKGWYDYVRPVSAIRYMAEKGQRSDPNLPRYHEHGLRLEPGFIEFIDNINDPLAGDNGEHVGEIKLWGWLGPTQISDPETDVAGVGWIRAKDWWPYQRPTFVSPPFAGYISGHSTYSRAAAEVLTSITGSEYFPGGMGTFLAPQNEFLVFEEGPSETIELQWATYRDASDEVSLSRIWGGIHPPADDIPGRIIGTEIAAESFSHANNCFDIVNPALVSIQLPAPILHADRGSVVEMQLEFSEPIDTTNFELELSTAGLSLSPIEYRWTDNISVEVDLVVGDEELNSATKTVSSVVAFDLYENEFGYSGSDSIFYDTRLPAFVASSSNATINASDTGAQALTLRLEFDEPIDQSSFTWALPTDFPQGVLTVASANWIDDETFELVFDVAGAVQQYDDAFLTLAGNDIAGNPLASSSTGALFSIDITNSSTKYLAGDITVMLFPNPVSTTIGFTSSRSIAGNLQVTDVAGRVVRNFTVVGFGESWNIQDLPAGFYVATLSSNGESVSWSLIKQ